MKMKSIAAIAALSTTVSGCTQNFAATPVVQTDQEIRYIQGVPTTFSDKPDSSIQITPIGYIPEDQRLVFGAAAFNKGTTAKNFGLENISVSFGATQLRIYTRDELAHEARVKAAWAAFAVALAGAAAAYSANQNAYRTTNGYVAGPGGVVTFASRTYDPGLAYAGTAAATAATGYGIVSIRNSLDNTISHLNGSVLQVNTVDPGASAGGELVVDMPKGKEYPLPINISVNWGGAVHSFAFNVVPVKK